MLASPVDMVHVKVGVPLLLVTFDLYNATPSPSVNKLEDPDAIAGSVWPEESLPVRGW